MNAFKLGLNFLLCFGLLISPVNAESNNQEKTAHVVASDFVFVYEDGVYDTYKGDIGLKYAMFNDTLTGNCYHLHKDLVVGIAYATKKKFDIKNFSFEYIHYIDDDFYWVGNAMWESNVTLDNGTIIKPLRIEQDLTPEQKLYFEDYDTQLYKYYEDKKIKEMEDMEAYMADLEDDMLRTNSHNKQPGHFSGYTSRSGYIYGRYY